MGVVSAEVQLDLFGEVEAQEAQRKAADDLHSQPATCPCCGTTERNGWLLRNNHGVDPETGGIGGYPVREHPIYGAQCVAQSLVSSHITYYVREGKEDALEREVIRGRELGLDVDTCRRAAFLHDIGKAVTHEHEGSHALVGADLARRHGEHADIVHAIEAHHNEVEPHSVEAVLVQVVDAVSGSRPGARRVDLHRNRLPSQ